MTGSYEDVIGVWVFHEGPRGNDKTVNCSDKGYSFNSIKFDYWLLINILLTNI